MLVFNEKYIKGLHLEINFKKSIILNVAVLETFWTEERLVYDTGKDVCI